MPAFVGIMHVMATTTGPTVYVHVSSFWLTNGTAARAVCDSETLCSEASVTYIVQLLLHYKPSSTRAAVAHQVLSPTADQS